MNKLAKFLFSIVLTMSAIAFQSQIAKASTEDVSCDELQAKIKNNDGDKTLENEALRELFIMHCVDVNKVSNAEGTVCDGFGGGRH